MATGKKGWGELGGSQSTSGGKKGWGDIGPGYALPEAVEPVPEAPPKAPEKYTLSDFGGDVASVVAKGFIGAGEAAIGAIDWLLPGQQAKGFEALGWRPQEAKEFASSWESNELRAARKNVDDAKGFIGTLDALGDNPAALAAMIGESVPSIIGGGGLGKLAYKGAAAAGTAISGRVAAAIGEGAFGLGAAAESIRQDDPNRELTDKGILAAAGTGVGTGLLGFVGGKLAAKAGLGDIDTIMASGMTQATTKGFAKQLIGGGISEGVFEEMPQSMQEAMWSNFASGKDIFDGVDKAAAQGLAAGLAMGGVGGGYNRIAGDTPYKNQEQLELHRARVAGAAEAFTAAYQAYQQNPSEANQEALASAQSSYLAATKTRPALEEAADEAGRKNAAAILTAPSVDAALEAFNRLTETSSILRTGAEAANTVAANAKMRTELAGQAAAANPASPAPATATVPVETGIVGAVAGATIDPNMPAFQENMGEVEAATLPPVVAPTPVQGSLPLEVPPTPTAAPGQGSLNFGAPAAAPVTTQAAPVTTQAAPVTTQAAPVTTQAAPVTTQAAPVTTEAKLPKELAGASPRYNLGAVAHTLQFESDIDKAAYIAAQKNPSKRDADYVAFVSAATGMTEAEVRAHGTKVRAAIKPLAGAGGKLTVPAIWNAAPQQTKVAAFDKIKSISEKGGVTALLPASVRKLLTHDYAGSASPIITAARDMNLPKFDNVPTILKQEGVTTEEWAQFRAEVKEKVAPVRTAGVQEQIEKGTTAGGILDYLIGNADPRIGGLAEALKRFGKNNPYLALKYGNLQGTGRSRGEVGSWTETGEITDIRNRAGSADEITTLHEIVHLLTMSWINTVDVASPLYKELDAMRVAATAHWKATKGMGPLPYGLAVNPKDVQGHGPEWGANTEFLAEAMANQEFQDFLRTVPATKDQSLWDKFVGWVKDVIGEPDLDLNMLGQALAVVEKAAKKSTAVAKDVEKNKITGGGKVATADTISDIASRDPMERYVERVFAHPDPNMIDKLIDANEAVGKMSREQVEAARNGPASIERSLAELYAGRMDAGFDDGFDVINEKISELEEEDAASSMNDALGIESDYDALPEMEPDTGGTDAMEDFDPTAPVQHTPEEQAMNAALDQLWVAGGNNVATIQRTLRQSATELRLVARAAGNGARSALAAAMLRFSNIEDARVYGENRFADLLNGDIVAATETDRMAKQSDPEPSYAPGGRKPTYDFKQRLTNAYNSGALKKLAAFWQNVMSLDGQLALKTDAQSILNGQQSNNADYEKLAEAYNEEMFEKARAWAKDHNHPAPADKPSNRIIGFIKEGKDDRGKPIIMVSVSGRGRAHRGENPYLPTTNYRGTAHIDFNPASKMNEVHAMNLEGFPGSADIAYRVLADVAKAHNLTLPTSGQLMTNNNVRRPWQTVAASLRLSDPNLLSPMSGGTSPYGMDADLWPHLNDQERIGANILRHVHNALVSRPSNGERYTKIVISNGRALDNLSPNKDGSGFVATHEPNSPKGVAKGTKLDMREFTQLMKTVEAIGGDSTVDPEASRKGMGATSMAFAIMSQSLLDEIETNPYADVPDSATKVASKLGKGQHGWFFDQTTEQKSQLQEEIEAVRAVLTNPNSTPEEQAMAREVLRTLTADDIDMKIGTRIEEINHPQTSNGRRGEINREIAALRLEQRAKRTTMLDNMGLTPEARYDAEQAIEASDAIGVPGIRLKGEHYSHQPRTELDPAKYGTGYKGAERTRVAESNDPRLRNRVHFYADAGKGIRPESGVGAVKHIAYLDNIYPAYSAQTIQQTIPNTLSGDTYINAFETAVLDAGYRGYANDFGHQLGVVVFGSDPIPVMTEADIEAEASDPVVRENKLQDNPTAPLLNIGLDVGAGDRKMKINPSTARMLIERTGAKITRSNVVESTYTHKGEQVTERTLVAELDRPLNEAEATKLAELAQQEAISQRNNGDNNLFGPKASEWGAFDPTQFVLLDGKKMATRISSEDAGVQADTIEVDGVQRPTTDSDGRPIHPTEAGIRNFWQGFKDSKVVDAEGRPIRLYTGTSKDKDFTSFNVPKNGAWFADDPKEASMYAQSNDSQDHKYDHDRRTYVAVNTAGRVIPVFANITNPYKLTEAESEKMRTATNYKKVQGQIFELAKLRGYDGVDIGGGVWVALKDGSQIKSAIGNTGEFSQKTKLMNRDEPIPPAVEQKIIEQPVSPAYPNTVRIAARSAQGAFEKRLEKLRVRWQEQHATLARVLKNLGIKAEDIGMDVLGAITRSKGLIQSNLENLVRDPLAKIENDLFNAGVKDHKAKIEAYLKWRHAPEANAQAAKINPYNARTGEGFNLTDRPGSGITTEEAVRNLVEMDQSPDGPALREAAKQFDAMITGLQNYAVEHGLESADTIAAWRNVFPNYAPFYRDLDLSDTFSTGAQGYSTRSGVSRRFMGSEAEIQPILASTRLLGQRIVNRGETARVAQTLLKLAKNNTPMFKGKDGKWHPMWKIDTFPNVRTVKVVNVYRFKNIDGDYVLNGGGVPIEFYSQNAADAYLETNTNAKGGPKSVESLGPKERMVVAQNPDYISRDNVVIVPVNGENVAVVFNDESEDAREMYRNLKNMDTQHLGPILAAPAMVSRWVVATATGYNPIFSLFNFARDVQATAVNMNAEKIPGWNGTRDTAAVVGESFKNAPALIAYLQRKQNKLHSNEKIDITPKPGTAAWWMEKAKAAGGLTGIMDSLVGMSESEAQIRELFGVERKAKEAVDPAIERVDKLDRAHERFMGAVEWLEGAVDGEGKDVYAKTIGAVTTRIANLNQGAELATRTAAFKAAYEKFIADGKTDAEASTLAANISKGISVNFNRKGQWSGVAGAAFPFFNAAAQGSARFFESVFEKESVKAFDEDGQPVMHQTTKLTPFGMKLVTALPALGILQAILLAGYDDDEISEADKSRNFIIPAPWGEGGIIKIPLPLGLNVPFNMGREMADMVIHPENFVRHATNLIMEPISGFNPLGGAGNHIQTMMPAILDPIVGLLQNRDAFGRPIAKEDFDKSKPTPGHTRAKEGASTFGKGVSYGINYATGGGKYGIGVVSPTPDQVDYVLGQITGGVGREAMKALSAGGAAIDIATGAPREEVPWYKVAVVGKVYGNVNEAPNVKVQIYDAKTKVAELKYEHAQMVKAGEREAASAFLAEHPEIKLASRIDEVLKQEADLRKRRLAAREKDDVLAAQKANEQIDAKLIRLRDEIRKIRGD